MVVGVIALASSCAPTRFARPLAKGEQAVSASFGGPLIEYGNGTIPIPLTSIAYGTGVDSNLTIFGGLHTTALLYRNFQMDIGATYQFMAQDEYIPAISASPVVNFIFDIDDPVSRFWPQADLNLSWATRKDKDLLYVGAANWFELRKERSHSQEQLQRWIFNPHIGYTYKAKEVDLTAEIKIMAPGARSREAFIPYKSILGNNGATGIYLSAIRRF